MHLTIPFYPNAGDAGTRQQSLFAASAGVKDAMIVPLPLCTHREV